MKETLIRTLSGIVYIIILVSATLFQPALLALFGLFLLLGIWEYCRLFQLSKTLPMTVGAVLYILFAGLGMDQGTAVCVLAATLFVSALLIKFLFAPSKPLENSSAWVFLIGYVILPMVLITRIPHLGDGFEPQRLIAVYVLIWANDTFAFVVGKTMGRHKLFERISPKKTLEGFAGGAIFALIFGVLIAKYCIFEPVYQWVLVAMLVSIFGTLGDLVESKFKRLAGVKDSGKIMPGHGGILDRLDSLLFVAPVVFLLYQILFYVS